MTGSHRPSRNGRVTLLWGVLAMSVTVMAQSSVPDWYTSRVEALEIQASNTCKKIGVYCGGSKCCKGLVCEPVMGSSGQITPRCGVPDPSTMDGNACYDNDHVCFFHNQCCSGHCEDLDADHIFECTPKKNMSNPKPYNPDPYDPYYYYEDPDTVTDLENVHWNSVDSTIPMLAIMIGSLVLFIVVVMVVIAIYRRRRVEYQSLGVDEIPSEGWSNNNVGGKYHLGWHDELIHEYSTDNTTETSGPPLPPRDYVADQSVALDESSQFTNVAHSTPVRPIVDFK